MDSDLDRLIDAAEGVAKYTPLRVVDERALVQSNGHLEGSRDWLDRYVSFSRLWSPRAYEGYHEACGLWILSTIAQRRVGVNLGGLRYGNLYLALVGSTSLYAKSTTAKIAIQVLYDCGLEWLLAHSESTPQAFIKSLSTPRYVDKDYVGNIDTRKLSLLGGRGWYYDEFGGKVRSMVRDNSTMSEYRTILRRFDDCEEEYVYDTVSRGVERVHKPYLSLLANMTPGDLTQAARRDSPLWHDGLWPRFAFICPPGRELKLDRFPKGKRIVPSDIVLPLVDWNERLGWPRVDFEETFDAQGNETGKSEVWVEEKEVCLCDLSSQAIETYYNYHDKLTERVFKFENEDLSGNYIRFAEKALRIALLLTSLEGKGMITEEYLKRGIEICEKWRSNLHSFYEQVNNDPGSEKVLEEKALVILGDVGKFTAREMGQRLHVKGKVAKELLDAMVGDGVIGKKKRGKTFEYFLVG